MAPKTTSDRVRISIGQGVRRVAAGKDITQIDVAPGGTYIGTVIEKQMLRQIPVSPSSVELEPIPTTRGFIDRKEELKQHRKSLEKRHFTIIEGMPGIGKTWLGSRLVSRRRSSSILWITFRDALNTSIDAVLWEFARFFLVNGNDQLWKLLVTETQHETPYPINVKVNILLHSLRDGRSAIVCMDNYQLVLNQPEIHSLFTDMISRVQSDKGFGKIYLVIMTRESPTLSSVTDFTALEGLKPSECKTILEGLGIRLQAASLKSLLSKTEGNPQLIRLFSSWFTSKPIRPKAEIAQFIARMPGYHLISRYLINNIFHTLSPEEERVVKVVAILRMPQPASFIMQLAELTGYPILKNLTARHIIRYSGDSDSYDMHTLVREATTSLTPADTRKELHNKAANLYIDVGLGVEAAYHFLVAGNTEAAVSIISNNIDEIVASGNAYPALSVLTELRGSDLDITLSVKSLQLEASILVLIGEYDKAIQFYNQALTITSQPIERSQVFRNLGNLHGYQSKFQDALELFNKASLELNQLEVKSDLILLAKINLSLDRAYICIKSASYNQALSYCSEALNDIGSEGAPEMLARVHGYLGDIYYYLGQWSDAVVEYTRSLALRETIKDVYGASLVRDDLGNMYYHLGEWEKAINNHIQSIEVLEQIGDIRRLAIAYSNLGMVKFGKGEWDETQKWHQKSLECDEKIGNLLGVSICCNNLGILLRCRGEWSKALSFHQRALRLACQINNKHGEAYALGYLGCVELDRGYFTEAVEWFFKELGVAIEVRFTMGIAFAHLNLSEAFTGLGLLEKALNEAHQAREIFLEQSAKFELAKANRALAVIMRLQGNITAARNYINESLNQFEKLSACYDHSVALIERAHIHFISGNIEIALSDAAQACQMLKVFGATPFLRKAQEMLKSLKAG